MKATSIPSLLLGLIQPLLARELPYTLLLNEYNTVRSVQTAFAKGLGNLYSKDK